LSNKEAGLAEQLTGLTFDPSLGKMRLNLQLGERETGPRDIASSVLATVPVLERLDTRPMEWAVVPDPIGPLSTYQPLPGTAEELAVPVEAGAHKDASGRFYPHWGYYIQVCSFLQGTERRASPFDVSISDGAHKGSSDNSFSMRLERAHIPHREAFVECFAELVDVWHPMRGAVSAREVTKRQVREPIWYPPVGVLTYFAQESGYVLPESPLVELRRLKGGTLAVLKEWTLDAVLAYVEEVKAVNEGVHTAARPAAE
jgi:hypothetical protein